METEAERNFALECGARYLQGYLFARPALELMPSDAFAERFARLRHQYVKQKLAERSSLVLLRTQLTTLMSNLKHWAESGSHPTQLMAQPDYPWLLRTYQCDRHGTQSPNLEWRQQAWHSDNRYLGHNWSWRPYFYQLLAEGLEDRRLSLSGIYRDATTNQYCITVGQFVDNGQRLLLIDIDAEQFRN